MTSLYDALAVGLPAEELARTTALVRENERAQVAAVRDGTAGPDPRDLPVRARRRPEQQSSYQPVLLHP